MKKCKNIAALGAANEVNMEMTVKEEINRLTIVAANVVDDNCNENVLDRT